MSREVTLPFEKPTSLPLSVSLNTPHNNMAPRRALLALALVALALTAGVVDGAKKADKNKGGKENVLTGAFFLFCFPRERARVGWRGAEEGAAGVVWSCLVHGPAAARRAMPPGCGRMASGDRVGPNRRPH